MPKKNTTHQSFLIAFGVMMVLLGLIAATIGSQSRTSTQSSAAYSPAFTSITGVVPSGTSTQKPNCYQLIYRGCLGGWITKIGMTGTGNIGGYTCKSGYWTVVGSNGPAACSSGPTIDIICGSLSTCPNYYLNITPTPSIRYPTATPTRMIFPTATKKPATPTPTKKPLATAVPTGGITY